MVMEDVDIVQAETPQALVDAGAQVLACAAVAVRARAHDVAGLGSDDEFVTVAGKVAPQNVAEDGLRRPGRWAVIVGQIETGDAQIEGSSRDGSRRLKAVGVADVVPQPSDNAGNFSPLPPQRRQGMVS